eukprot:TRINITY_DN2593_c0_g1_i1.p2 TRINITY_DN2593_c0_g1~~TRINITY_DN2593_c0_g1_i1.p2  ORF type:complete len:219 (+),score=41.14 TRINITY_DN2593_c0_g1_i1:82-738(+)
MGSHVQREKIKRVMRQNQAGHIADLHNDGRCALHRTIAQAHHGYAELIKKELTCRPGALVKKAAIALTEQEANAARAVRFDEAVQVDAHGSTGTADTARTTPPASCIRRPAPPPRARAPPDCLRKVMNMTPQPPREQPAAPPTPTPPKSARSFLPTPAPFATLPVAPAYTPATSREPATPRQLRMSFYMPPTSRVVRPMNAAALSLPGLGCLDPANAK